MSGMGFSRFPIASYGFTLINDGLVVRKIDTQLFIIRPVIVQRRDADCRQEILSAIALYSIFDSILEFLLLRNINGFSLAESALAFAESMAS